jgi:hypothetical protein
MEWWNDGMMVFEESYPYMNNFHFPVKRDVESVIPVFPPKKKRARLGVPAFLFMTYRKTRSGPGGERSWSKPQTLSPGIYGIAC